MASNYVLGLTNKEDLSDLSTSRFTTVNSINAIQLNDGKIALIGVIKSGGLEKVWYKFEDNAANTTVVDSSAFSRNGNSLSTNTSTLTTTGVINNCFNLTAASVHNVTTGFVAIPSTSSFSINIWFSTTTAGNLTIVGQSADGQTGRFKLYLSDGAVKLDINGDNIITSESTYNDGEFYNLILTRDSSTFNLYLNTVLDGTGTYSGVIYQGTNTFIGLTTGAALDPFNGKIDDFRMYDFALDSYDRTTLYNDGSGTTTALI